MDYQELLRKKDLCEKNKGKLPEIKFNSYVQAFEIEYTHNSTAIEGNTRFIFPELLTRRLYQAKCIVK